MFAFQTFSEQMAKNREISAPLILLLKKKDKDTVDAARRMFSSLTHLESIALSSCERGAGVEGQYDDEAAHAATFSEIAEALGGLGPAPDSIAALTAFLAGLRGEASLVALNIVGEAWLGNLFDFIGTRGPWADLFEKISKEEARHSALAQECVAKLSPAEARPLVACLEELLWAITIDPEFSWPVAWFCGLGDMGATLGRSAKTAHARACTALGIEPGFFAEQVALCGRHIEDSQEPKQEEPTETQKTFFAIGIPPIRLSFEAHWKHRKTPAETEARVIQAVGAALSTHPRLNRTVVEARREIWCPRRPIIGVRRKDDDDIVTVYVRDPQTLSTAKLKLLLLERAELAAAAGVKSPVISPELARLAPASRAAATVTCVTPWTPRGGVGTAPLAPGEGATISVCVTSLYRRWGRWFLTITIEADHRAHNGEELARLGAFVQNYLER